ncbi:MAG: 3-hydroxyacyl-CoA dehydrogenase family protein [Rhodopseudomonas palustris]|nr:3-hydroxyacyl-CoA dehydrogenase family protein [Rhodopseudomonas palustris]
MKKEVFAKLDAYRQARRGAGVATPPTSTLMRSPSVTKRPQDVLGMHFFSPANVMKLLRDRARRARPRRMRSPTAMTVGKAIGKVPVVVGVCDGFVGNRMLAQRAANQAEKLLFEGALPRQVDRGGHLDFGLPMGPFAMGDLAGLDIGWRSRQDRGIKSEIADALCEAAGSARRPARATTIIEAGCARRCPILRSRT